MLTSGRWHAFVVMYRRARPHRSRWTRSTPCSGKTQTTRNPSEPSRATWLLDGRRGRGALVMLGCQCILSPALVVLILVPALCFLLVYEAAMLARRARTRRMPVCELRACPTGQGLHLSGRCQAGAAGRGLRGRCRSVGSKVLGVRLRGLLFKSSVVTILSSPFAYPDCARIEVQPGPLLV